MIQIIELLEAIYQYAKDIHYTARGESFYSVHLLMDRVADGIHDQIDSIKEVAYLGDNNLPPKSSEILKVVAAYIPELSDNTTDNIGRLEDLISKALDAIAMEEGTTIANDNLLGGIAESLTLKRGLLWQQK